MNKVLRNLFIFILVIVFIMAFSSSYLSLSMDNLAYVLAIGIEKTDNNKMKVSFQFSTATPPSESGSTKKTPTVINSVTASSLSSAINLMNSYLGKELNSSHCKVIIFSEEFAYEGIVDEIYTLINDVQIRPSCNIIVSKCSPKYYISKTVPELENLISKYYEIFTNSSKYTGFMPDATIGTFFNNLNCKTCEPYAILGGLNSEAVNSDSIIDSQKDYDVKSNESPIQGENKSENIGVAVFKGGSLVGELNAIETIAFLNMRNSLNRFLVSVPDPHNSNYYIDIYLTPEHSTDIKVDTSNGSPYIQINMKFSGRIYSMSENSEYLDPEVLSSISNSCNSYLESVFLDYLYKTSKDFKSDINGFGKFALRNFVTNSQFEDYNWLESYKDAFFHIDIDTSVESSMLITET